MAAAADAMLAGRPARSLAPAYEPQRPSTAAVTADSLRDVRADARAGSRTAEEGGLPGSWPHSEASAWAPVPLTTVFWPMTGFCAPPRAAAGSEGG